MKITCFAAVTLSVVLGLAFADELWNNNNFNNNNFNNNDDGLYRNPLVGHAGSIGVGGGSYFSQGMGSGYGKGMGSGYGKGMGSGYGMGYGKGMGMGSGYGQTAYVPLPAVQSKGGSGFGGLTTLLLLVILFPFFFNKQNDNQFIFLNTTN